MFICAWFVHVDPSDVQQALKINTNVSKLYKTATCHLFTTLKPFSKACPATRWLLMLRGGLYIIWRPLKLLLCTGIPKIPYLPSAGPGEVMCFKHYHAEEVGVVHLLSCTSVALTVSRYVTWNCCSEISVPVCRCCWGGRWRIGWGSRSATGTPSVELVLSTRRVYFTFTYLIYICLI